MAMKVSFCWLLFLMVFIVYLERSKAKQTISNQYYDVILLYTRSKVDDVICTLNLPWKLLIWNPKDFY